MSKYIDVDRLRAGINQNLSEAEVFEYNDDPTIAAHFRGQALAYSTVLEGIDSLQQEQPDNMIQWTGDNLKEVIDFTGKSPRFGEWFKPWEEYENYVHPHNNILKLFCEDGSHYEVPIGAWIVKTPDGYNVPSVARFIHAKPQQPEVDLKKEYERFVASDPVYSRLTNGIVGKAIARHFYELGLNARKEE